MTAFNSKLNKIIGGSIFVTAYYVSLSVIGNIPFFQYVVAHSNSYLAIVSLLLLVPILNFFAAFLFLQLTRIVGKVVLALLLILNAICFYYISVFHTMMDETMLGNVYNTQ